MSMKGLCAIAARRHGRAGRVAHGYRDDAIMPLFCPTSQNRFRNIRRSLRPAQVLVSTAAVYCAWGCFRIFCLEWVRTCRAAECRRPNTIAKSGIAAIHDLPMRRINKPAQAAPRGLGREPMQRVARLLAVIAGLCASALSTQALAQKYPVRPVKVMVGFSAGGPVDVVARIIGDRLGNKLGQPFVVENRAGANGMIAAEGVARAEGDGYTMLACNSSTITLNKTLFKDIRYDPQVDFAPLTTVVSAPLVLVVNPENPRTANIRSVADLVAAAKAAPGALAYGSGGNGNLAHLAMELLSQKAGIKLIHVPYRGGSAAEVGILAQEVLAVFDPLSAVPLVKAGKLRALAVSSAERLP
ncbi:Bug family tripartite tricarboxylate transporter substrate binding protein, partial [Bradyrhizobium guangdongense]|uniref:Bug family tripartite tricarboxylate transporter substrate binding protein n=1 Tax=Bradyrhizobium guangdongense TaxID=1325090 RepID=UPI001FD90D5C